MANNHNQVAMLNVLYSKQPNGNSGRFLEVRRWETPYGEHAELVVEHGTLVGEELETKCLVMPFHLSTHEALQLIKTASTITIETNTNDNIGG